MTVSELLCKHLAPILGGSKGVCFLCSGETEFGHSEKPSQGFTGYDSCHSGNVICEFCWAMYKTPHIRSRSWICTEKELIFSDSPEKKEELFLGVFLNPPSGKWCAYLTKGCKKHGYQSGIKLGVNQEQSSNSLLLTDLFDSPVIINHIGISEVIETAKILRTHKVSKDQLLSCEWSPLVIMNSINNGFSDSLTKWKNLSNTKQKEVVIHAIR